MKQLLVFFMFLLVIPFECRASCIAGDCINGGGTETHPNGEKYVGQYKDGNLHGQGTYPYNDT